VYEHFAHTADVGIHARGSTVEELFEETARGLFALLVANPESIRPAQTLSVELEGTDLSYLLFDWLGELLYAFDVRRFLACAWEVSIDGARLQGVARGETNDPQRHHLDHEVKAITYHALDVHRAEEGWEATVIVDI
jgi:SHS2 domain-containing protein